MNGNNSNVTPPADMHQSAVTPRAPDTRLSQNDILPPVEPPSAGFIVQLFVVPGVIVLIIVCVYFAFTYLSQAKQDPQQLVEQIKRNNAHSWQAALSLAEELRRDESLRTNGELAQSIADYLDIRLQTPMPPVKREDDRADPRNSELALRVYLIKALGEFTVPRGVDTLVKVAAGDTSEHEISVRHAAIASLALLAYHNPEIAKQPKVIRVMLDASQDESEHVRKEATYALGVFQTPEAEARLKQLLVDSEPDVRYNAAIGLARNGDMSALGVLEEMLDLDEDAAVKDEDEKDRPAVRAIILLNALRAVDRLAAKNPNGDFKSVEPLIRQLTQDRLDEIIPPKPATIIATEAKELLKKLQERNTQASESK